MTTKIKAVVVNENKRLSFLPKYFDNHALTVEQGIYNTLSNLCSSYRGAFWNYYELSNGGFYLAPSLDENLDMVVDSNGYSGTLSADAAGIIVSLYVINHLCWLDESELLINRYYLLRDYAAEHNEADEIFSAID